MSAIESFLPEFLVNSYQATSLFLRQYGHNIILSLASLFYILSFIPLYSPTLQKYTNDDFAGHSTQNCFYFEGAISPLMVGILPAVDLLLDFLAPFTDNSYSKLFNPNQTDPLDANNASALAAKTTRLSKSERLLYWVGLVSASVSVFPVYRSTSPYRASLLYNSFTLNGNMLLTISPILSFLCRSSTTWTPLLTIAICLCLCIASALSTAAVTVPQSGPLFDNLTTASSLFMTFACALYFSTWLVTGYLSYNWFKEKGLKLPKVENSLEHSDMLNEDQIHFTVVGAQSTATLIDVALNVYWYWYVGILTPGSNLLANVFFVVSASAVCTFLIEFRIRKSEVSTALYALLDSKKYISHERYLSQKKYMGYISNELRIPLNVALLGVNLSRQDVQKNADPKWSEGVVETLEDVELACKTAVKILNSLLNFEQMGSGILELHKEPIAVLPFLKDCARFFSLQAREKGVFLKVDQTISEEDAQSGLCAVLPTDEVMGDRLKLEQVLRNLISNALKFTSKGGNVTLSCFFKPGDIHGPVDSMGRLVIRCTDQGIGISPENQAKLFRGVMQFSSEKLPSGGGAGVGMFITKGIVELHKGTIGVWSQGEGFGTTFTVEIPMQRGQLVAYMSEPHTEGVEMSRSYTNKCSGEVVTVDMSVVDDDHECDDENEKSSLARLHKNSSCSDQDVMIGIPSDEATSITRNRGASDTAADAQPLLN